MSSSNIVSTYYNDIEKLPPLTQEEVNELVEKTKKGDIEARNYLVQHYLLLVMSIVPQYTNKGLTYMDLVQEGNLGLIKCVENYNPEKGKFSTYASWWINQSIGRAIQNKDRIIRIPVHILEDINKMKKLMSNFTNTHYRYPTDEELANLMNKKVEEIKTLKQHFDDSSSLDTPLGEEDDENTVGSFVIDTRFTNPEDAFLKEDKREKIKEVFETLTEREADVITKRLGSFFGKRDMTLEEIGEEYGLTKERIRQIENKALRKLRNPIRAKMIKDCLTTI